MKKNPNPNRDIRTTQQQPNPKMNNNQQAISKHTNKAHKDEYVRTEPQSNITYTKADIQTIDQLKAESERHYESLRQLVKQMLQEQGIRFKDALSGEKTVIVDEKTRTEAQAQISEGRPHSPENVSDRIINFAKAISGGDKSKIGLLTDAIKEGFKQAAKILGGDLPEVSRQTYDLIMEKLDQWASEGEEG